MECLPDAGNAGKSEHAALIITTFVHDHAGFQKDGSADNELGNGWDATILVCRTKISF